MSRALQLWAVHFGVALRLTGSRSYRLPRLTLAMIAGGMLLFFARHFNLEGWGPVATSFVTGFTCLSLLRSDVNGRTMPVPLPPGWVTAMNICAQLTVCVAVALAFMMVDTAATYAVVLGFDSVGIIDQSIPRLLSTEELQSMAIMMLASAPVALVVVHFGSHIQQPANAWTNRGWKATLAPLYVISVALIGALVGATELESAVFAVQYLQVWLGLSLFVTSTATLFYGWTALRPPSPTRVRPAKPAMQQLIATVWVSQAIKWVLLLSGLALYTVAAGSSSPLTLRSRPMIICYVALLSFFSMFVLTSGQATSGHQQFVGLWKWKRSGWRMVPASRPWIQRALMLDLIGFAVASTIVLHTAALLATHAHAGSPPAGSWAQELNTFTVYFTWFIGFSLPAVVLFFVPRRHFGRGLSALALASTFWAIRTALLGRHIDIGWTLPLKHHLVTVGFWTLMAVVVWAQTASPSGRIVENGANASRLQKVVGAVLCARRTRWSVAKAAIIALLVGIGFHRHAMNTEISDHDAIRMTAEQTDRLIRDLERIHALGILGAPSRTRDAAPAINPYIGLDDGTPAETVAWWDDIKHKKKLQKRDEGRWYDAPADITVGDLSITKALTAFDHWETGRVLAGDRAPIGKYEQHLDTVEHTTHLNYGEPFPNLVALFDLTKFRLLHGLRTGDMLPALAEVRHLARLVYSDETLVNTISAVTILQMERRAFDTAVEREMLSPTDWAPISRDDGYTMIRVAVSMAFVMSGGADESQWRRIVDLPFEPFGLCGGIHEAMTIAQSLPNLTLWPGELFPRPSMDFVDHAVSTSQCSIPLARYDHRTAKDDLFTSTDSLFKNPEWHHMLSREISESAMLRLTIPYLRGHAWMDTQYAEPSILMYGDTPEDDWSGGRRSRPR